jgi:hypothetical protein
LQNDMAPGLELLKKLPRLGADSQRPPTA